MEKKFKTFDRVIIRLGNKIWKADLYSHYDEIPGLHKVVSGKQVGSNDILPYEGNEHLVGTTDEPDEEVRLEEGEWIIPADKVGVFEKVVNCIIRQFDYVEDDLFKCKDSAAWAFAIRFSDFNPNDMEETKKKILCVKNGKVIRYKG